MKFFSFLILFYFSICSLTANSIFFTKEEQSYIDVTNIQVAMVPNIYPFNMYENGKLNGFAYDVLQLVSKKSGLNFNYELDNSYEDLKKIRNEKFNSNFLTYIKDKNYNMDFSQIEEEIPLAIFSSKHLKKYYNLDKIYNTKIKSNKNIFFKNYIYSNDIFEIIENYGLTNKVIQTFLTDVDLVIAPLLKMQANIIKNGHVDNNVLSELKIPDINKTDMLFGINKEDKLLQSIIKKSFSLISEQEWNKLNKKWKDIYLSNSVLSLNNTIKLNLNEEKYIRKKKIIKICTSGDLAPISFLDKENKLNGLSLDILTVIQKQMNIFFKFKITSSILESKRLLEEYKCDIILNIDDEELFNNEISFTNDYLSYRMAIITKKENPLIFSVDSILNEVISLKKDSVFYKKIRNKFPSARILKTKTHRKALELVNNNNTYFTISALPIASYYISKHTMNDLYISLYTDILYNLKMGVRQEDKILLNLLNKSLNNITKEQKKELRDKWITVSIKNVIDYTFIFTIIGIICLFLSILIYRQIILNKYNKELKKAHEETKLKSQELKLLTNNLEQRVKKEVEQNEQKSKHLIQQSRMAQMGELLSMIAHQWRQPLSYISTTANYILAQSLLKKPLNKKELEEELLLILDYSQHLSTTINDFKSFYKIDKEKVSVTIESIAEKSISIIKPSLDENGIVLHTNFNSFKELHTFSTEINQVILNLLKNAEDALLENNTNDSHIIVNTFYKDKKIYLEIIDNAGGIKEENINKLFDPYFSTKISKDGSGLGLYMSRTIIEDHCNGKINVKNNEAGATFIVSIPIE